MYRSSFLGDKRHKCCVCDAPAVVAIAPNKTTDVYRVKCPRCGAFKTTGTFSVMLSGPLRESEFGPDRRANISSHIRENQNQMFSDLDKDFLLRLPSPSVP